MTDKPGVGTIGWVDITTADAPGLRDFYHKVVGWKPENVDMGKYEDFNMLQPGNGSPAAGICHSRGANTALPAQWLIYITVADIRASAAACCENGGSLLVEPSDGGGNFCVIKDPAGAVAALYQPG